MRRFSAILIWLLLLFSLSGYVYGAGSSVTCTRENLGTTDKLQKKAVTCAWVSDDSAGTASGIIYAATYDLKGWILYSLETDPGATAPTDDYDVVINDANGLDMCAGNAANRDTSNTEMVACASSTQPYSIVRGNMTLSISAAGNSKIGTVVLMFLKD